MVALAGVGLAMDFVPATALGNAATAAVKAVVKFLPPGAAQALLRMGGSLPEACRILADLLSRIPAPPGASQLSIAANAAATTINQINLSLSSQLQLTMTHITDVLVILHRRATQHFKDEAVEGFAYAAKEGRESVIEGMFDAGTGYTEAVIEQSLDVLRETNRLGPLSAFSDDAIRGIGAATEAVAPGSPLVREFLQGTEVTIARANLALGNVKELRGVEGLDDMVAHFRHNSSNVDGIDGALFEGTVARRLRAGDVAGSGSLTRVSADGIDGLNRVDTLTSNWAIQVKSTNSPTLGLGSINGGGAAARSYLDELAAQARSPSQNKLPVLITNKPITAPLQEQLNTRNISWIQVAD